LAVRRVLSKVGGVDKGWVIMRGITAKARVEAMGLRIDSE